MNRLLPFGAVSVSCALVLVAGSSAGAAPSRTVEVYVNAGEPTHVNEGGSGTRLTFVLGRK